MNPLLEQNLLYLQRSYPNIYDIVILEVNNDSKLDYELTQNDSGTFNLYNTRTQDFMYSTYDPVHECQLWVESLEFSEGSSKDIVMYGIGLTYHLAKIIENYPSSRLFLYEPEVSIFIQMMKIVEVKQLFEHVNIMHIAVGKTEESRNGFIYTVSRYSNVHSKQLTIPFYIREDEVGWLEYANLYKENKTAVLANKGYYGNFGKMMFVNVLQNIPAMLNTPSVYCLKQQYKGKTAVVIGGGPSLEYDIEFLKQMQNKWLIIAAGSSVQSLVHYGIIPHLIVSMDPGPANENVFKDHDLKHIPLMYMPQIHHNIVNKWHDTNNVFGFYRGDHIVNYLISLEEEDYLFETSFSVTGTAIQAAVYLGANQILLTGQDLSYPGKKKYAPGTTHINEAYLKRLDLELQYEVENVKGETNPTTYSMLKTLEDIEKIIASLSAIDFINTSSYGAKINGTTYHPMGDLIDNSISDIVPVLSLINELSPTDNIIFPQKARIIEKLKASIDQLVDFNNQIQLVEKQLLRFYDEAHTKPNKAITSLLELEVKWGTVLKTPIFKTVLEPWLVLELLAYDNRILEISKEKAIVKKAKMMKEYLGEFIVSLKDEITVILNHFDWLITKIDK